MEILWRSALAAGLLLGTARLVGAAQPGEPAPDLATYEFEGAVPKTEGKLVYLDVWASWCGPCRKAFPFMNGLHEAFAQRGLVVVGVSVDESEKAMRRFLLKTPATFPVLRDAAQKLVADLDVKAMPTSMLIGRDGRVLKIYTGFHGEATAVQIRADVAAALGDAS